MYRLLLSYMYGEKIERKCKSDTKFHYQGIPNGALLANQTRKTK